MTREQQCKALSVDPESVDCPVCFAWVNWACKQTHAGRFGGAHCAPVHPARAKLALAEHAKGQTIPSPSK